MRLPFFCLVLGGISSPSPSVWEDLGGLREGRGVVS